MIKRWVHAVIALNAENQPVGVIYMENNVKPYPYLKPPTQVTQSVEKMPRIDLIHHPPINKPTIEQRNNAYGG